jgi:hypothetical protein
MNYIKVDNDNLKVSCKANEDLWNEADTEEIISLSDGSYLVESFLYYDMYEHLLLANQKDMDPYKIPNVNFSQSEPKDKRWEEYKEQRHQRGFDDTELWNFDATIAKFLLPRLKRFKEITIGIPFEFSSIEEWYNELDKIITAFQLIVDDDVFEVDSKLKIDEGLDTFRKYFFNLWY